MIGNQSWYCHVKSGSRESHGGITVQLAPSLHVKHFPALAPVPRSPPSLVHPTRPFFPLDTLSGRQFYFPRPSPCAFDERSSPSGKSRSTLCGIPDRVRELCIARACREIPPATRVIELTVPSSYARDNYKSRCRVTKMCDWRISLKI